MDNSKQGGKRSQAHDWFRQVFLAIGLCVAFSAEAAAQTVTYSVAGVQTAVADTSSSFVGVAFGTDGDLLEVER
jgi:uncharacterized membrane protein